MKRIALLSILCFVFISLKAQDHHIRIGFLGNSITIGTGLSNAEEECYPTQIGNLLETIYGDTCLIRNYAVSGRTMLKHGDFPLWNELSFQNGWVEAPDVCFIMLGTNDTKPQNWDPFGHEFHADYLAMMDTFKLRNPAVKFIVCYPPPAYEVVWGIRNEIIVDGVIPVVDSILTEREALLVDFYNPLVDSVYLFPDKIHPNADGAKVMAQIAFDAIVNSNVLDGIETGRTSISTFKTKKREIRQGDTTTISWDTRNATAVYIDGEMVDLSGSFDVAPQSTTDYKLVAVGENGADSLILTQLVYIPELSKVKTKPSKITINYGVEYDFEVVYYDQKNAKITDTVFPGTWEIISGGGELINTSDTMVTFVANESGESQLKVVVGAFEFVAEVTVREPSSINESNDTFVTTYPNPCTSDLYFASEGEGMDIYELYVFDALGKIKLCLYSNQLHNNGESIHINTSPFSEGIYYYSLVFKDETYSGKFIKK